ncbi:MAG: thiamine diphosphokinase [Candidatus Acetothermia bacterium]|nr:thiamine diphosphokinase [Candidatus Acetothermia bacterium]MDH7505139.1 thiamine diphosphokinase [Candidatus Acetothermia bacterium]
MPRSILILGNGPWHGVEFLPDLLAEADYIIAADGGAARALRLGLRPQLVVGDLDSLGPDEREALTRSGLAVMAHPAEKDQTDLELALDRAISLGPERIVLFGVLGARLDQSLVNIFLLEKAARAGVAAQILAGRERIWLVPNRLELAGAEPGELVSLLPLSEEVEGVQTWGLRYPLRGERLTRASSRGISNEVTALPAGVELKGGLLLVIHRR